MLTYLSPKDGPVVEGFEPEEVVYAKGQPEYIPLRTLVGGPQRRVTSRWALTPEQRTTIADGADIFLTLTTFGKPLQPILLAISNGDMDADLGELIFG
jgi:hemin uptake protein HemP